MDLNELRNIASVCTLCDLHNERINPVFDKGNSKARLMIVGMVPAHDENKAGLPFVGRAGKLLDGILGSSSLSLQDVYITNLVKCYVAAGKQLKQDWIDNCLQYLINQIYLISPKIIITLGQPASISVLGLNQRTKISSIRGKIFHYLEGIKVIPTFHPSYLLRIGMYNSKEYHNVLEDFNLAKTLI